MVFFQLQTVWEAEDTNTAERGPGEVRKYGIQAPVGFDAHLDGARLSNFMRRFGTGGTPWSMVIDKEGIVRFSDFTPQNADVLARVIESLRRS